MIGLDYTVDDPENFNEVEKLLREQLTLISELFLETLSPEGQKYHTNLFRALNRRVERQVYRRGGVTKKVSPPLRVPAPSK